MRPPPDREAKTDPPLPTDPSPPADLLLLSENVLPRLAAIETKLVKLEELHDLLMGGPPKVPGGKPRPSIVSAIHDLANHVGAAVLNAEHAVEKQEALPKLVAQEVANKMFATYQDDLKFLRDAAEAQLKRMEGLEGRISQVEADNRAAPNGSHKSD